ncbi:MAG: type I-E CRISPR-associated protein Cas7/Cse4/CasC [Fibrobacter sp.]|nr:type I-E CRISPR-associated protein Cas7/Cse4/CasC [Fibrobacter sp.]
MSEFIQIHVLTAYPPSNANRDDMGRPKTAVIGGVSRLRISSQCLKRTWRVSDVFTTALAGNIGTRTKLLGNEVFKKLVDKKISEKLAKEWAQAIAGVFGKLKSDSLEIEQLVHVSPQEITAIDELIEKIASEKRAPEANELNLLRKDIQAADIAMFGRMLASSPSNNMDAAIQVSHAFSVARYLEEDDYFTAVDDLNKSEDDQGSAHIGEAGFGSGIYYLYICINKSLLIENLQNNTDLANKSIKALTEAALTLAPSGKQNSFASRVRASYAIAEKGTLQPRSLAAAFFKPVTDEDHINVAINSLVQQRNNMDMSYGKCYSADYVFNPHNGKGTLNELLGFVAN